MAAAADLILRNPGAVSISALGRSKASASLLVQEATRRKKLKNSEISWPPPKLL